MEKANKDIKISLAFNVVITVFTIAASIMMYTGYKFMHSYPTVLSTSKIGMFRFFTVQSNIFVGIVALLYAIKEIKVIKGKEKEIPFKYYILKMMATAAVGLTFFVVFTYLGPISKGGIPSMLMNSNLFFHFIIPVLSILTFIFYERTNTIKVSHVLYGIVPTVLYEIYYLVNVLIHMENGKVSPIYDWYWFVQNGVWTAIIVAPMILVITYIITLIIWRINRLNIKED